MFSARVLLRAERLGAVEVTARAGWEGPPLHHHAFDEAFYVLEGELTVQLGDDQVRAGPDTFVVAPADTIHTLANHGDTPARYLLLCAPGGFERRFDGEPVDVPRTIVVGGPLAPQPDAPRISGTSWPPPALA
jgi:mannose-6-phosphate isomerase-like protein (cupin superfamily)